jgi:hypothetical protein
MIGVSSDTQVLVYDASWKVRSKCADKICSLTPGVPLYPTEQNRSLNDLNLGRVATGEHARSPNELFTVGYKNYSCMSHSSTIIDKCTSGSASLMHVNMSHGKVFKCSPSQLVLKYTGRPGNIRDIDSDNDGSDNDGSDDDSTLDDIFPVEMVSVDSLAVGDYLVCYDNCIHDSDIGKYKVNAYHEYGDLDHHLVRVCSTSIGAHNAPIITIFTNNLHRNTAVANCGVVFEIMSETNHTL